MTRPRILDLFCGAGGAAMGYHCAGFDVVGVDIEPQPHYPFEFWHLDALEVLRDFGEVQEDQGGAFGFDAIHASPPCQAYSVATKGTHGGQTRHPALVETIRELLEATGLPWVMENVPGAPLRSTIVLCGSMFGLGSGERQLRRHRLFETSVMMMQRQCHHIGEAIGVYGGGPADRGRYTFGRGVAKGIPGRRGGYQGTIAEKREAMGIDWMSGKEIDQAIPPAYTEFVGTQLLQHLETVDS